jgi:hypothetical protein
MLEVAQKASSGCKLTYNLATSYVELRTLSKKERTGGK